MSIEEKEPTLPRARGRVRPRTDEEDTRAGVEVLEEDSNGHDDVAVLLSL